MTVSDATVYSRLVEAHGLGGSHRHILALVPPRARVLDAGCASGYLAAHLSAQGCEVVGFERDPGAAAAARAHCADVVVGDLGSPEDRAAIPGRFDVVVFGDVLEHLADPWKVLRATHDLLAPGGVVVASLPNVAAWPVRLDLLRGRFDYADFGLLDRTHLRFFTRATAHALARECGFAIAAERLAHLERAPGRLRRALPRPFDVADRVLVHLLPGLFAQQFVLCLRPAS